MEKEHLELLQNFVEICKKNPSTLQHPSLAFFREWLSSLGCKVSPEECPKEKKHTEQPKPSTVEPEDSPESELELDTDGVIEADVCDGQEMGNDDVDVTEEMMDQANNKRSEAMTAFNEGNHEMALNLYSEAIKLNPHSAPFFAKRSTCYLKLHRPNGAIKDCNRAIQLNPDSALAYKCRGMAHRLLGHWEEAFQDLTTSSKLDYSDDAMEYLKEVEPKAKRIIEHKRKQERKRSEKELNQRKERVRKAREEHEKARQNAGSSDSFPREFPAGFPGAQHGGGPPGGGPPGADNLFGQLFNDPELMQAMQDPEVMQAFSDVSSNPGNMFKYQNNPKVQKVLEKMQAKFGAGGGGAGMFGGDGGPPGAGGMFGGMPMDEDVPEATPKPADDDLD